MIDWDANVIGPCMSVFGEDLKPVYQRAAGGAAFTISGVFDDAYLALMLGADGEAEIATIEPTMGVRLSDFGGVSPVKGDTVTVTRVAKTYLVVGVEPDGKGWAFLRLNIKKP